MPPPILAYPSSSSSNIGRSLYKRILRELRATRNFDHHLRDIRFLLWVPGTKGKRQYDELKRLAVMSASLHRSRKAHTNSIQQQQDEVNDQSLQPLPKELSKRNRTSGGSNVINVSPSIADQIRAVARGLFRKEQEKLDELSKQSTTATGTTTTNNDPASSSSSPAEIALKKAKMVTDGTRRAFWAIKRLQDIRSGLVPNASMWLVQGGSANSLYQNYLGLSSGSNSSSPSSQQKTSFPVSFDPFAVPKTAQMRSGNFPFLHEFLGIDEHGRNQHQQQNQTNRQRRRKNNNDHTSQASIPQQGAEQDPVELHLQHLQTFGKSKNKVLKLELVSRCAAKDGPAARYHLSFRLENISEFAVDVKLAHLFAVKVEQPPNLDEMVCLLPLLGNSLLSPYSASAFQASADGDGEEKENGGGGDLLRQKGRTSTTNSNEDDDTEDEEDEANELNTENLQSVRRSRSENVSGESQEGISGANDQQQQQQQQLRETPPEASHHQFSRKIRQADPAEHSSSSTVSSSLSSQHHQPGMSSASSGAAAATAAATTTASLPFIGHSKIIAPDFTAKARTPDHCAVYDVTFPVQGECVLRGFLLYRTISNSFPPVVCSGNSGGSSSSSDGDHNDETESSQQQQQPSSVKSRLKVLHLPVIKLQPPPS